MAKTKSHSQVNTQNETLGTIPWAAPEYLTVTRYEERNEKGDIFSFGVIAWELVTQQTPWEKEGFSSKDVKQHVKRGGRLKIPKNCPEKLQALITMCWQDSICSSYLS